MKTFAFSFVFVLAMPSLAVDRLREPIEIIQEEGQFVFTGGASFYLFKRDGAFQSAPLGLSGRVITGHWKFQLPSRFMIEGH